MALKDGWQDDPRPVSAYDRELLTRIDMEADTLCHTVAAVANAPAVDGRWAAIAKTQIQLGLMCLRRAVTKDETF